VVVVGLTVGLAEFAGVALVQLYVGLLPKLFPKVIPVPRAMELPEQIVNGPPGVTVHCPSIRDFNPLNATNNNVKTTGYEPDRMRRNDDSFNRGGVEAKFIVFSLRCKYSQLDAYTRENPLNVNTQTDYNGKTGVGLQEMN
jgi:hypothetical protein